MKTTVHADADRRPLQLPARMIEPAQPGPGFTQIGCDTWDCGNAVEVLDDPRDLTTEDQLDAAGWVELAGCWFCEDCQRGPSSDYCDALREHEKAARYDYEHAIDRDRGW